MLIYIISSHIPSYSKILKNAKMVHEAAEPLILLLFRNSFIYVTDKMCLIGSQWDFRRAELPPDRCFIRTAPTSCLRGITKRAHSQQASANVI